MMNEPIRHLRSAARAEAQLVIPDEANDPRAEELLDAYFAEVPESNTFLAALDVLGEITAWPDAPAGSAAASASALAPVRTPSDVASVLGIPRRQAREAIESSLVLTRDAADVLLDRPAAVLLRYDPSAVRGLTELCGRPPGQLFARIASSTRASGGYVFPYRPGDQSTAPVKRLDEAPASLLDWGYTFFGLGTEAR